MKQADSHFSGRGIYILYDQLDGKGVNRKVSFQLNVFMENGFKMDTFEMTPALIPGFHIWSRLPFSNVLPQWKIPKNIEQYDFLYMRRPGYMNHAFIKWAQDIKKINPKMTMFLEIPSYPYDKEYDSFKDLPLLVMDRHGRKKLKTCFDYLTTPCIGEELNAVRSIHKNTLQIINPYDFSSIELKPGKRDPNCINIIMVARFCPWHGGERLLEGLKNYYQNQSRPARNIVIHFIGDGKETEKYKDLTQAYGLEKHVRFYGFMDVKQIQEIYPTCDIAADSFGGFKKNAEYSCSLKTREYLAVGLPIIAGLKMDIQDYPELKKYVRTFPNNDTPVDFEQIIAFHEEIYVGKSPEEVDRMRQAIRKEAQERLDYTKSMDHVIEILQQVNQ